MLWPAPIPAVACCNLLMNAPPVPICPVTVAGQKYVDLIVNGVPVRTPIVAVAVAVVVVTAMTMHAVAPATAASLAPKIPTAREMTWAAVSSFPASAVAPWGVKLESFLLTCLSGAV